MKTQNENDIATLWTSQNEKSLMWYQQQLKYITN